jgi:hypothetical protein
MKVDAIYDEVLNSSSSNSPFDRHLLCGLKEDSRVEVGGESWWKTLSFHSQVF